jgi:hypothetical protein
LLLSDEAVIVDWVSKALKQGSCPENYEVLMTADTTQENTRKLHKVLFVHLIGVLFENSTKVKAPNSGIERVKGNYALTFARLGHRRITDPYVHLPKYFRLGTRRLPPGVRTLLNAPVLRNIQLPRLIERGLMRVFSSLRFLLPPVLCFSPAPWMPLFSVRLFSSAYTIPVPCYDRAFIAVPPAFDLRLLLLFRLKEANGGLLFTGHGVSVQDAIH